MPKTYTGYRRRNAAGHYVAMTVTVHEPGRPPRPLDLRHDLRLHSLEFNWGYGGSGPAQLALALAADVLGDDALAQHLYQRYKFRVIGKLADDGWTLTEDEIRQVLDALRVERGDPE